MLPSTRTLGKKAVSCSVNAHTGNSGGPNATKEFPMKRFLILVSFVSTCALAQEVKLGEAVNAAVSMCATQSEAEEVVKAHQSKGIGKASEVFGEKCFSGVVNVVPEQVVGRYQTDQGTMKVIRVAVLMKDNSRKTYFILTTNAIYGET